MKMTISKAVCACLLLLLAGCDNTLDPIYDEDREFAPDPAITRITPEGEALGGVGVVTIMGENFSPEEDMNLVFFGGGQADVLTATPTRLEVRPPDVPGENLQVKVTVIGAENFAVEQYTLRPAVEPFGTFTPVEEPVAIAGDDEGNIYASMLAGGTPDGIIRINQAGERSAYAAVQAWTYSDMRFGPDGGLYAVRGVLWPIYRVPPGGGEASTWLAVPGFPRLASLDFDAEGNIWAGGDNENLYRVSPDKSVQTFPFEGNVQSLRVFENTVYVAAIRDSLSRIWRAPIDGAGSLGAFELYFDFSGEVPAEEAVAQALAFANDGALLIGTDAPAGIVTVSANGEWEPYYGGLFEPSVISLAWGNEPYLYGAYSPSEQAEVMQPGILKINTQKEKPQ